ncbi:conjugal transfer protein [Enterococcus sp. LJL128]
MGVLKKEKLHYEMIFKLSNGEVIREPIESKKPITKEAALKKFYKVKKGVLYFRTNQSFPSVQLSSIKEMDLKYLSQSENQIEDVTNETKSEAEINFDGKMLSEKRKEMNLSQVALGKIVGIPARKISDFERGKKEPSPEEREALLNELGGNEEEQETVEAVETFAEENLEQEESEVKEAVVYPVSLVKKDKKKRKKNLQKPPKGSKKVSVGARVAIWGLIAVAGGSGIYAVMQAEVASSTSNGMKSSVSAIEERLNNPVEEIDLTTQTESYFKGFIPVFMNMSSSSDEQDEREGLLKTYFPESFSFQKSSSFKRTLTNFYLYEITEEKGYSVAAYVVEYELEYVKNSTTNESEKEFKEAEGTYTQLLSIPFVESEGLFAIVDYPYFSVAPALKGMGEPLRDTEGLREASIEKMNEVSEFLKQFYTNYANSSTEDIAYMMEQPETLSGSYEFLSSQEKVYEDGENVVVKATVTFRAKGTDIEHAENMTLKLNKKENKYFVEKLLHNQGGIN